jgi:hypothetical protein
MGYNHEKYIANNPLLMEIDEEESKYPRAEFVDAIVKANKHLSQEELIILVKQNSE